MDFKGNYNKVFTDRPALVSTRNFSDKDPRDFIGAPNNILRHRKVWISSRAKKYAAETPERFSVRSPFTQLKSIRYMTPVHAQITYVATATPITSAFIYFPDFGESHLTSENIPYHAYIPVVSGADTTTVAFNYTFGFDDYNVEFTKLENLKDSINVQLFKEISAGANEGALEPFTELTSMSIEMSFGYIDQTMWKDYSV
jgi:hypothetical protein